jgi:hypothetical protein
MGLKNDIYVHHILVLDRAQNLNMAPLTPMRSTCPGGKPLGGPTFGTVGSMNQPKGSNGAPGMAGMSHGGSMTGMSHSGRVRREVESLQQKRQIPKFSIMLGKGNEGDQSVYASVNSTVKSGYWIG